MSVVIAAVVLSACATTTQRGQPTGPVAGGPSPRQLAAFPSIAARTAGLELLGGLFPLHFETGTGKLLLEVPAVDRPFLYYVTLAGSSGSGGLFQPGSLQGEAALVRFERHGARLLLIQENPQFRTADPSAAVARALEASYAGAVIGSFTVVAEEEERVLVDATDFFLRDAGQVSASSREYGGTAYRLDRERSAIHRPGSKAFPRNTEVEALLTFTTDQPDPVTARHAPDGRTLTVRLRHSLVELPPPGFSAREADPRLGFLPLTRFEFDRHFHEGYRRNYVQRWRLEKQDPAAAVSEPVEPITFYLDPAIPPAYRTAIRDGTLYWNAVFESAGFRNAIRVEELPDEADPLDIRYSMLQWMPRTQAAPSFATWLADPRTGEILKATLFFDSHRSLVDYNTYMGLRPALRADAPDAAAFVMARRRWLAAHEVAHALAGFLHTSVDPSAVGFFVPGVIPTADDRLALDLSQAFLAGPAAYDEWLIRYAYTPLEPQDEAAALAAIAQEGLDRGLRYVSDYHAGTGSLPVATGRRQTDDVLADLEQALAVRRIALARFDETAVEPGEPLSRLFGRLVPVYFHHRYLLFAAAKAVGGYEYAYAARGDGQRPTRMLPPAEQRRALNLVLSALLPEELAISSRIAALIPPPPYGETPSELEPIIVPDPDVFTYVPGESPWIRIPLSGGSAFDPLAWARTLASSIVADLLHATRAARLVTLHARDPANPSLDEVIRRTVDATWGTPVPHAAGYAPMRRISSRAVLAQLLALAENTAATPEVRAMAGLHLTQLARRLEATTSTDAAERAHIAAALRDIERWKRGT
jgi:hypothetical protein